LYVCASQAGAERVLRHSQDVGLSVEARTLRVETLSVIREAALTARQREDRRQVPAITVFSSDLITEIPHPGWA